jgi:hypothetical protein
VRPPEDGALVAEVAGGSVVAGGFVVVVDDAGGLVVVVVEVVVAAWLRAMAGSVSTTSCGAVAPVSRLAYSAAVLSSVVSARLTTPSPRTSAVTSTLVQLSRATGPEAATTGPGAGALA